MTAILGVSCDYHDAAAALVVDGIPVAAVAEERLSRIKHDSRLPELAIAYCLKEAGLKTSDLDAAIFYEKPMVKFERILTSAMATAPRSLSAFVRAMPPWLTQKLRIGNRLRDVLGPEPRILYGEHHLSHAASAFLPSPFERAAILTLDGVGEWETAAMGIGEGSSLRLEQSVRFPHSLGLLYSTITAYMGFRVNDDEWKVMGLAPYGKPAYADRIRQLIHVDGEGGFRLDLSYFDHHAGVNRAHTPKLESLLGFPPRAYESEITDQHRDLARSVQLVTEEVVVALARAAHARYGTDALCIAGGVGLNSVANWKILEQTPVKRLFVQPACGDDGAALGAALFASNVLYKDPRRFTMEHAYWGPAVSDEEACRALTARGARFEMLPEADLVARTAKAIAENQVVGWVQGRMEFGPRALGNRSILANPQNNRIKEILNAKIKFRETFRPFAPSVLREAASTYFEMPPGVDSPFMLLVPPVKQEFRARLPGITHADGSGRVQTVERRLNPRYYDLIAEVGRLNGIPVVVNTSFNVRGEPIVGTPDEALDCFLRTGMDVLVIGRGFLTKPQPLAEPPAPKHLLR